MMGVMGGKAVPERTAWVRTKRAKSLVVSDGRVKKLLAHVLGVHQYRTALTEKMDERCLFVKILLIFRVSIA